MTVDQFFTNLANLIRGYVPELFILACVLVGIGYIFRKEIGGTSIERVLVGVVVVVVLPLLVVAGLALGGIR